MAKRRDKQMRSDPAFIEDLKKVRAIRFKKDLDKELMSIPELTRRGRNAPKYREWLMELSTMPKKEDLK